MPLTPSKYVIIDMKRHLLARTFGRLRFRQVPSKNAPSGASFICSFPKHTQNFWLYLPSVRLTNSFQGVNKSFTLLPMIESFKHKGLQELFEKGTSAKLQKALADRALRRLDAIDIAKTPEALNIPGFDFHGLQGKPKRYSVHVNGPWCITFEWQGENAVKLDFENYH